MRRMAVLALAWCCGMGVPLAADNDLQRRQAEARRDQEALRERIREVEKRIVGVESSRRDVTVELKASESAISELDRRLENLAADTRKASAQLGELKKRISEQSTELARRQTDLAELMRAQYAGGLSPWAALLSGDDPQDIARELGYLEYVSKARAESVQAVRKALDELASLRAEAQSQAAELRRLAEETESRMADLKKQQATRLKVLQDIEKDLKQQRGEAQRLANNEQRLGTLVDSLAVAIEEEAAAAKRREEERRREEAKRRAEEKRLAQERQKAEELRRAEERRMADEQRQAEERRRAEDARKVEEARQAAEAIRSQTAPEERRITGRVDGLAPGTGPDVSVGARETAPRQPEPVGSVREVQPVAPEAGGVREAKPAAPEPRGPVAVATPPSRPAAPAPLKGLNKGLPHPVKGEVYGRFGMERPEGGTWRGIVLRAAEGTTVAAVAPGRVVYAGWLGGFGNIMIVDHGAKYLSVYAYNQSLLKQVGDPVRAGDAIARVGATGGQVEPGLYFEIRHEGKPVNPQLWLSR